MVDFHTRIPKYRYRLFCWAALAVAIAVLAGCLDAPAPVETEELLTNRILVWHNLLDQEATAFENAIARYRRLNPHIDVIVQRAAPEGDQVAEFIRMTRSGLGPDLLLADSARLESMLQQRSVRPIDEWITEDLANRYLASALQALQSDGSLYGLPVYLNTTVLYFHEDLVERPPTTLEELLTEARNGRQVLMNSSFTNAFWGAKAFGINLLVGASQEGVETAGVSNWLSWMEQLRDTPGILLDTDDSVLQNRFLEGDIAYYVGSATAWTTIKRALDDAASAAVLPSGPSGSSGPFLTAGALFFNAVSSEEQAHTAFDLARFLTNSEQQGIMMRDAQITPANLNTRISPGLYPEIAAFEAQARTAIPWPNDSASRDLLAAVAQAYGSVMSGTSSPTETAAVLADRLATEFGLASAAAVPPHCPETGTLTVQGFATGVYPAVLRDLAEGFRTFCPGIEVVVELLPAPATQGVLGNMQVNTFSGDLLLFSHGQIRTLVESGALADVTDQIDKNLVQQIRPPAVDALRQDGKLYGIPLYLDVQTWFYNRALVPDPAGTLDDLRSQARTAALVTLDGTFERGFWGIGAFGGRLFNEDGQFVLPVDAQVNWLNWLKESRDRFQIALGFDQDTLRDAFVAGTNAYYLGMPEELATLRRQLGPDRLGVALLPEGPAGPGRPLMWVTGLLMNGSVEGEQQRLALRFLEYAAGAEAQSRLLASLALPPANSTVALDNYPLVRTILGQAQNAQVLRNERGLLTIIAMGDLAFGRVLVDGDAPEEVIPELLAELVQQLPELATPTPTPAPIQTITPTTPATPLPEIAPDGTTSPAAEN